MFSANHHWFTGQTLKTTVMVCEELSYLEIRIEKPYGIVSPFAIFLQMRGLKSTCTCKNNKVLLVILVSSIWNKLKKKANYCYTFYNSTFGCHSMNAWRHTCSLSEWNALSEILSWFAPYPWYLWQAEFSDQNLWRAFPYSLVIYVFVTKTRPSYICQIFFRKEF